MKLKIKTPWKRRWKLLWWLDDRPDHFHIECLCFAYSWYSKAFPLRHIIFTPWAVYEWSQDV